MPHRFAYRLSFLGLCIASLTAHACREERPFAIVSTFDGATTTDPGTGGSPGTGGTQPAGTDADTTAGDGGPEVDGATPAGPDGSRAHSCPNWPLPAAPCFTCDPLPADVPGGCGAPLPMLWGWDGSGVPEGRRYPLGCIVLLPVENPFYRGTAQACDCADVISSGVTWQCGL
jgi:hypothetical protein